MDTTLKAGEPLTIPDHIEYDLDRSNLSIGVIVRKEKDTAWLAWHEKGRISGHSITASSNLASREVTERELDHRNLFATRDQALASMAVSQLTQHLKDINKGWVSVDGELRYCIRSTNQHLWYCLQSQANSFLSFQKESTAKKFLVVYRKLIEEAAPILFGTVVHTKREETTDE